jgi:hypothetical protein
MAQALDVHGMDTGRSHLACRPAAQQKSALELTSMEEEKEEEKEERKEKRSSATDLVHSTMATFRI